jgi:hypothetical protein
VPVGRWEIVLETGLTSLGSREVETEGFTVTVLQRR